MNRKSPLFLTPSKSLFAPFFPKTLPTAIATKPMPPFARASRAGRISLPLPRRKWRKPLNLRAFFAKRARRIREVLSRIQEERGTLSLDFLAELSDTDAEKWLLSLPGVGKKTAYVVLLFAFGREKFPVDTHIARVTERLGLWDGRGDPHDALAPLIPAGRAYRLHLNLIRLGREFCRPRKPRCTQCPLLELCQYGKRRKDDAE